MRLWHDKVRKSARAIIVKEGRVLLFLRKRYNESGEWIEYYSIPGGGIDRGETPEQAAVRELLEEMGIHIKLRNLIAHRRGKNFEHYVYSADVISGEPHFVLDSEEALHMSPDNQFIVEWVPVDILTKSNLLYYSDYLELMQMLASGNPPKDVLRIDAR